MMMKKRMAKLAALGLALLMTAGVLAGCGDTASGGGAANTGQTSGDGPKLSETVKDVYTDDIKIAYLPNTLASGNGTIWGEAAKEELSEYENITFNIFDGKGSAQTQNEVISELIVEGYDALILQPADASALGASVTRAEEAGIKVITLNIGVEAAHSAHIVAANIESGQMAARMLGEAMGGEGTVGLIDIASNMASVVLMGEGFKEVMAEEYPNITVVADSEGDWTAETANSITRDYLSKYPDMAGIYTCGDPAAVGAMQAAAAAGREDLMIWGCDGEATVMEYIEEGAIAGTIYMDYWDMGKTAARLALYSISNGINGATYSTTPTVKIPAVAITKDNVDTIPEDKRW